MKTVLVFLVLALSIGIVSCEKVPEPSFTGHRFSYYVKVEGTVKVDYQIPQGVLKSFLLSNSEWHQSYDVVPGDKMYLAVGATYGDCLITIYLSQDGKRVGGLTNYILHKNSGRYGSFTVTSKYPK